MDYAVIRTGGKQYKVKQGDVIEIDHLGIKAEEPVVFDQVLLHVAGDAVSVGTPTVQGLEVSGTVLDTVKGEKIRVAKFKAKSRYRRVNGHRSILSKVRIDKIGKKKQS